MCGTGVESPLKCGWLGRKGWLWEAVEGAWLLCAPEGPQVSKRQGLPGQCQTKTWAVPQSRAVGRMMVPKDVHVLVPGTCKYVPLHGKGDFADGVEVRILRWGDDAGLWRRA